MDIRITEIPAGSLQVWISHEGDYGESYYDLSVVVEREGAVGVIKSALLNGHLFALVADALKPHGITHLEIR